MVKMDFDRATANMDLTLAKYPALDREKLENFLETNGFSRVVAGDAVFDKALDAITLAEVTGRGLLITGGNGVGKTRLLKAIYDAFYLKSHIVRARPGFNEVDEVWYNHEGAQWIDCNDDRQLHWLTCDEMLSCNIFLDDFGSERMLYGDFDAVGAFICRWHTRHGEGLRFYMSTNLSSAQIDNRSGGRVLDRLCEICVTLVMGGESKRKGLVVK